MLVHRSYIYEKNVCIFVMVIPKALGQRLLVIKISLSSVKLSYLKAEVPPASVMLIKLAPTSLWNTGIFRLRGITKLSQCSRCTLLNSLTLTGADSTGIELPGLLAFICQTNRHWVAEPNVFVFLGLMTLGCQPYRKWVFKSPTSLPNTLALGC